MDQESIDPARGQHAPEDPIAEPSRHDGPAGSDAEPPAVQPQSPWQPSAGASQPGIEQPPVVNLPQSPWQPAAGAASQGWQPAAPVANLPQSTWQPNGDAQPATTVPQLPVPMAQPVRQVWPAPVEPWHPPLVANADLPPGWHAPLRTDLAPVPPRRRRSKRLIMIAAAVVVLLVAGVTTWLVWPPDRSPFEQAVANLAAQPVVNYRADLPDGSQWDGRTTTQGDAIGWLTAASLKFPFLIVNGRLYVQLNSGIFPPGLENALPNVSLLKNRWVTGDLGELGPLLKQEVTPAAIADKLRDQVARTEKLPTPDDEDNTTTINNIDVLKADTPDGTLYVAKNQPYRVVRWIDKSTKKAAAAFSNPGRKLQLNGARASYTGLGTVNFTPMSDDDVDRAYDDMETDVGQLGNAIDSSVRLKMNGFDKFADLKACIPTGCPVTVHFTATPKPGAAVPAQVTMQMNAEVTLNDLPAGSCSVTAKVASSGDSTLTCVDKDMQGPYAQADEKAKANALAESGGSGYYFWYIEAKAAMYVVPLASVDTVAEGKRLESFRPDHACGWTDKGGAGREPMFLKGAFTARYDTARFPDFEIHVFQDGRFYGDFGSNGWIAKPGSAVPADPPHELEGELKIFATTFMKAHGPLKDSDSIDGDSWKRPAPHC